MDLKKEVYLSQGRYYGKVSFSCWGDHDLSLFSKYGEPDVEVGDTITDGTTSFNLTVGSRQVKSGSPFTAIFDPVELGVAMVECGKRANAYVNVMTTRIDTAMNDLRDEDIADSLELNKTVTV